jgi:uncharacterized protein YbjT (DUF2867 family)
VIVVAGATGQVGGGVARNLLAGGEEVRVVGRHRETLRDLAGRGAQVVVGDLGDAVFLAGALGGAAAAFLLVPPDFDADDLRGRQNALGGAIAQAVRESGVTHVVNLSCLGAHLPDRTGPLLGLRDQEQQLDALEGVNVLHLRPAPFMENLLLGMGFIRRMGFMGSALRGDVRFAMIAVRDVAAHAARRLSARDFTGSSVAELLGQRDLTVGEVAEVIGRRLGKPCLRHVTFPPDEAYQGMRVMGLKPDPAARFLEMSQALNQGLFAVGLTRTLENTTPTSIEEFAGEFARVFWG